ncbi:hypothetical protein VC83_09030 [Pseudogymnoascus destructans]|uniref:DUF7702 domain-containing protein n=1 Tax=Pseudogymnoascus destructans TaxID=655981 RepID=A0A177A0M9_9PEZI|nr:uncharacterized protein VC83_09030 [Pseudogymnoascus destructans]OAF54504.2 hypothetical protein VC83_09030 [Pseudogymnoascus destructans]
MQISILKACLGFCQIHRVVAKCATSIRGIFRLRLKLPFTERERRMTRKYDLFIIFRVYISRKTSSLWSAFFSPSHAPFLKFHYNVSTKSCLLLQPVTYCLWKHGKRGLLGWLALHSLCVIRIVGNTVQLNAYNNHSSGGLATLILQSVGLSPLILGAVGILHEARRARDPTLNRKFEWILVIQYHLTVIAAMVLVIMGIVKLQDGASVGNVLMKVGMGVVLACWAILAVWTLLSFRSSQEYAAGGLSADGTKVGPIFVLTRTQLTPDSCSWGCFGSSTHRATRNIRCRLILRAFI